MPWCEACDRFFNPPSMGKGGECPTCGRVLSKPAKSPWHFKMLVASAAIYVGWRAVQGLGWVVQHIR